MSPERCKLLRLDLRIGAIREGVIQGRCPVPGDGLAGAPVAQPLIQPDADLARILQGQRQDTLVWHLAAVTGDHGGWVGRERPQYLEPCTE